MKLIALIFLFISGTSLHAQGGNSEAKKCGKSTEKFDTLHFENYRSIVYANDNLTINFTGEEQVDSIHHIVSNGDTLDRLKDNEIRNFEEILPYMGISDWKLIVRIIEICPKDRLEKELRALTRTYKQMTLHLFGNFSKEGYALVRTNQGYNFIDRTGQLLFDCYFENATNFINGLAKVKINGAWMSINPEGKISSAEN